MARSLLAEIQHQSRIAAREFDKQHRAAVREHSAALRRMEQARKADERARVAAERAAEVDRKRLEKEAKVAHIEAMEAEVEERNTSLTAMYEEIDGLLAATLGVDDYVDLNSLKRELIHPAFDRQDLEKPLSLPALLHPPTKPSLIEPEKPGLIRGRWTYKRRVAEAQAVHERAVAEWKTEVERVAERNRNAAAKHERDESERLAALRRERARYQNECEARAREVAAHNAAIDTLSANLGYGVTEAVNEYISIVMANSVYPGHFRPRHEFSFDPSTAELNLCVIVSPPASLPTAKAYKYSRSSDEITETSLPLSALKTRYASAVHQVALRSLHEVFEADRRGIIKTISLEVSAEGIDPATGNTTRFPFVAVSAERSKFMKFNLAAVVPAATLEHLGAAVSKDPFSLICAEKAGIRRS